MEEKRILNGHIERKEGMTAYSDISSRIPGNERAVTEITDRHLDYASMVPEDEKAVAVDRSVVTEITDQTPDYALMVPEDERAVTEKDELDALLEEIEPEVFSPVRNMKGFQTDTGHRIFAQIHLNSKGQRIFECVQQYSDGTFSEKLEIPQADLVIAAQYRFLSKDIEEPMLKRKVAGFMQQTLYDYTGKIRYPDEQMEIICILNILIQNYKKIPHDGEVKLDTSAHLYKAVIQQIRELGAGLVDERESYYTLFDDQMESIAQKLCMKKLALLKQLNRQGVLYLQESSEGYQINVRFKGDNEFMQASHTERCYGIYKPEFLAECRRRSRQS